MRVALVVFGLLLALPIGAEELSAERLQRMLEALSQVNETEVVSCQVVEQAAPPDEVAKLLSSSADAIRLLPQRIEVDRRMVSSPEAHRMVEPLRRDFPNALFRGIDLGGGVADLRRILANGLETSKTSFGRVFLAEAPATALDYADSGGDRAIKAIFVVNLAKSGLILERNRGPGDSYYSSPADVPVESIQRIYVFQPDADPAFPFRGYTVAELRQLLGAGH